MGFITRGAKNAFRNNIRTLSIVVILALSIGLALTMLLARQAVQAKIDSVKSSIGNTITVSPAGAQGFEGGGEPLTGADLAKVGQIAHVNKVTESLRDRLSSDNTNLVSSVDAGSLGRRFRGGGGGNAGGGPGGTGGNFTPPVQATGSNDPNSAAGTTFKLTSGTTIDGASSSNVALIGQDLATKNNLVVGQTFTAYNTTVKISGIFDTGTKFSNNAVIFPLTTLQKLSTQPDTVSSATVQADSITNVTSVVAAIKSSLGTKADVTSAQDTASQALQPLENIKSITLYSLIGAVIAGAVIIFLTMLMIVRERRREIGVFKAIGASNIKITAQFVSEALVLTLLGAVVGVAGGALASNSIAKVLVASSATSATSAATGPGAGGGFARAAGSFGSGRGIGRSIIGGIQNVQTTVGWDILLYGLLGAVIIAIVGSAIPAYLISKVRPAEVMRAE